MAAEIKWTLNHIAKSDDKQVENMSVEEMQKAGSFHRSFPQYAVTPLTPLSNLAKHLGLKRLYVKDESYRFGTAARQRCQRDVLRCTDIR